MELEEEINRLRAQLDERDKTIKELENTLLKLGGCIAEMMNK